MQGKKKKSNQNGTLFGLKIINYITNIKIVKKVS